MMIVDISVYKVSKNFSIFIVLQSHIIEVFLREIYKTF